MTILGIDEIVYGAPALDACQNFSTDWGFALVESSGEQLVFESLNEYRVRVADPGRVARFRRV